MASAAFSSSTNSSHPIPLICKEQAVTLNNLGPVGNSILFAVIGLLIYGGGFYLLDRLTPYHLWREINEKQNSALAILVGSMAIGLALIISAAIHG
jgi:putative membrane protein